MHLLQFRYIPFHEPLLKPEEWSNRDALLIFPAVASRNAARRRFQNSWSLSSISFVTTEEFKEQLFLAPSPMLKEEKRTLAFYASLDAEAKEFFRIHTYFQSVELANQFFRLWDECGEARLALADAPAALAAAGIELLPWQEKTLLQLLRIKELYSQWIAARGFSDRIFIRQEESLDFTICAPFDEIILVNPFHLTGLEKMILRRLQSMDRQVTMLCQLPQGLMDEETLEPKAFSAHELGKHPGQRIFIWECRNEVALYTQFLQRAHQHQLRHAVDVALQPSTFQHFLSPARFRLPSSTAFSESSLYHFFATLGDLIESLVRDGQTGRLLLPLPALLAALQRREFYHPMIDLADPVQRASRQELAIALLHELQQDDLLYMDLGGHFFQTHHRGRLDLEPLVRPVLRLIIKLLGVQDLNNFSQIIDGPEGVPIRRILSAGESKYSNILELFYQTLADFTAIGELGVVDAWRALFPGESETAAARGILRLFLEYIKSKRVRYEWNVDRQDQIELTNFAEACSLSYERLALLQVIEGQLPRARSVPWLFTEQQRKFVGLDTWDDIRLREKYAFFRLALSTPELHLFTIKNIEKNIEPSSFVEELLITQSENVKKQSLPDIDYRGFSRHFLDNTPELALPMPVREQPEFFSLPFDAFLDFPEAAWRLSFYAYKQLTGNPFEYALRTIARVPEWPEEWKLEVNRKLLGKISQAVFDLCWKHFNEDALPFSTFERIFESYGERAISSLFADNWDYYYRLPKNHELIYFREFTLPVIRSSCRNFFQQLHERYHLDREAVRVFPETEFTSATEMTPKLYLPAAESGLPLDILLQGRTDLRIETGEPAKAFIVDYKTGVELNEEQLWFYELFYYLIENPGMSDRVRSCFYLILEERFDKLNKNLKKSSKEEFLARFRGEMMQFLLQTASVGYLPARRRSWREKNLGEIIRMDIYHPR